MKTATQSFKRICAVGSNPQTGTLFVTIDWDGTRLSITGVEGPKTNGDARGSCGQCTDSLKRLTTYANGWTAEDTAKLGAIWDEWHLNDMTPGCPHQKNWDTSEQLEIVHYKLTTEAYQLKASAIERCAKFAAGGIVADLTETEKALIKLENWYDMTQPPDADSPLSGWIEVAKREHKTAGWVTQKEHPRGLLSKPCEVCGYKYGSAWNTVEVPADVLEWLEARPDNSAAMPACWKR